MEFTGAQKLAINLRDRNILVSAAAGSGKTATLTERIIQLLTDAKSPSEITSMLIVTFTRAAAAELRTRISRELGKALALDPSNTFLAKQLTSLGSADICTIDSYYLNLVRSNFQRLGLPAKFRLADETELQIMRHEIMNAVIERRYRTDDEFSDFADEITTARSEGKLAETLLDVYKKVILIPGGTDYLRNCADAYNKDIDVDFFSTAVGRQIKLYVEEEVCHLIKRCNRLINLIDSDNSAAPYGQAISSDLDYLERLQTVLSNGAYSDARDTVYDYVPQGLGRIPSSAKSEFTESVKNERTAIKDRIIKFKEREFCTLPEDIPHICAKSARLAIKIADVLDDFISAYNDEKNASSICEFSDLRKYALNLLVDSNGHPTPIALEEQKKYKHIFVDEYQDTDAIQDLVFNTISNGSNLFFVGDIKQSIYSFRGAEPSVFAQYRKNYMPAKSQSENSKAASSVFMSENFRCSPNIISFTNAVCSYLFRECEGEGHGIGYVAQDDLIASRPAPYSDEKVKVVLLDNDDDSKDEDFSCQYIIFEIKDTLENKLKCDGKRYLPKDIAILTRSNKDAAKVADSLAKAGIPYANSTGNDLFENSEVLLMFSLLSACDNPQRDIPLAAVLRSPIFGFTLSELVKIKLGRKDISLYDSLCEYAESDEKDITLKNKCVNAITRIDIYRSEAEALPVHIFMRFLWKDTNALTYAGSDEASKKRTPAERRRNLRKFYEYARKYEASSYKGLHDFVEYVSGIISQNTKISDEDAVTDNTVRIMTVHKSKGLEFPIVFLYGAEKKIEDQDSKKNMIFSPNDNIGIAFKISDNTGLGQIESPYRIALANNVSEKSSEEEIRILYVALTRARDVLYVVSSGKVGFAETKLQNAIDKSSLGGRKTVSDTTSWIERILIGLAADQSNRSYQILTPCLNQEMAVVAEFENRIEIDENEVNNICEILEPSLNYKYPFSAHASIPAKVSVSKLYPELLNETDDYADIIKKAESLETKRPRFMGEESDAAERGTATHLFMQFCEFSRLEANRTSIKEEISRLVAKKFIPQKVADLIRVEEIVKFVASDFYQSILKAKKLYREFRFNIFLPAVDFTNDMGKKEDLAKDEILVQGVIDLCFIDDNDKLILCDYKTDRIPREIIDDREATTSYLEDRHAEQLKYYAKAIERIMGKSPDQILIYSLSFGDALEINV